jgi:glycosyltransferase involved in cell wall biosynthesis
LDSQRPPPLRSRSEVDLSVVIPVYNHERFVGEALGSALSQRPGVREVVCIDDGSTDGSLRAVESIARKDSRVRFWSRPNQGAHRTLNEGIAAARGELVAILNSDDVFLEGRIARCASLLGADPGLSAVFTEITCIDQAGRPLQNPWLEEALAFYREVEDLGLALVNANFLMTTSNLVARRELFDELGPFDNLRYAHDLDFFLRMVAAKKRVAIVPKPLLAYRQHASNTISEAHGNVRLEWAAVAALFSRRVADWTLPDGRSYANALVSIIERHKLGPLVMRLLLHLDESASGKPGAGDLVNDPALRNILQEVDR